MVYSVLIMRFKNPKSTHESALILGVDHKTIWKWGKKGLIKMLRDENGYRIFDGDELSNLAPLIRKDAKKGFSKFPSRFKRK